MTRCLGHVVFMAKIVAPSFGRRGGGIAVFVIV